jgi:hypothetical protein
MTTFKLSASRGANAPSRASSGTAEARLPGQVVATIERMTEPVQQPLEEQLEEIGTQLAWVRDYL